MIESRDLNKESIPVYKLMDMLIKYDASESATLWINDDGGLSVFSGDPNNSRLMAIINLEQERMYEV